MKHRLKLVLILAALCVALSSASAPLSKRWVLKLDHETMDSKSLDELAHQITKEHNFKLLRPVGDMKGYYVAEFNEDHLNSIQAGEGETHHHVRRKRELAVNSSVDNVKAHPVVQNFEREPILVRKKRDFIDMPSDLTPQAFDFGGNRMIQFPGRQAGGKKRRQAVRKLGDSFRRVAKSNKEEDPMWPQMWYLNRHSFDPSLPDLNVTAAWAQGYSGQGISVTFLDDGLEWNHPDLMANYDSKASTDINGNSNDPMPRYDDTNENKHGTRCAGEVAAVANNSLCSVGIAFRSGIGGIRMLDGDVTDSVEASSLSYNTQHIDIYSASWGPDDNGEVVDGPGPLGKKAFIDGAQKGRNGLGSIFVWASGNGGRFNDSCACDGYANSIYTLSISSTTELGEKPWYLEECTSTLATAYSSGNERAGEREIMTTDIRHKCTAKHTGTSAAAPLAAGIIALVLEANPRLSWRDVMYITVLSARAEVIRTNNYIVNKRGFLVSNRYGFGLMDAGRMVELAKNWTNVPPMQSCSSINSVYKINSVYQVDSIETTINTDACKGSVNEVNFIEQVEIVVTIQAPIRGQLEIYLTSPMGTKSLILPKRPKDMSADGFKRWAFMSVQLWGELPRGEWKLLIKSNQINDIRSVVHLDDINLIIHGTKDKPIDYERLMRVNPSTIVGITDESKNLTQFLNCHYQCDNTQQPCGPTENDCLKCKYYKLESDNKIICVSYCPIGFYADNQRKYCGKCHASCLECSGPSERDCLSCKDDETILRVDTKECAKSCPVDDGFFINIDKQCEPCDSNCKACKFSPNYCLECSTDGMVQTNAQTGKNETFIYKLRSHFCTPVKQNGDSSEYNYDDSCESGTYLNVADNQCESCDITCKECWNSPTNSKDSDAVNNNCLSCQKNRPYLTVGGTCVKDCGKGFYLNQTLNRCFPCESSCAECSELSLRLDQPSKIKSGTAILDSTYVCLKCAYGYEMNDDSKCVSSYYYGEDCKDKNCNECFGKKEKQCRVCKDDYAVLNGQCVLNAVEGYFKKRISTPSGFVQFFEPCDDNCAACVDETKCTRCKSSDNAKFELVNGQCNLKCGEKEYMADPSIIDFIISQSSESNEVVSMCKPCVKPCEKCLNATFCTSCLAKEQILFEGKCLIDCPENYYKEQASTGASICRKCHYSCSECTGSRSTNCTTCHSGYSFLGNKCISNCPVGSYYNSNSSSCLICSATKSKCQECIETPDKCTECLPGYGLNSNLNKCKKCCDERLLLQQSVNELNGKANLNKTLMDCCKCERNAEKLSTFVCVDDEASKNAIESNGNPKDENKFETFLFNLLGKVHSTSNDKARLNRILEFRFVLRIISIVLIVVSSVFILVSLYMFWRSCISKSGKDAARFGEYALINSNNTIDDKGSNGHAKARRLDSNDSNSLYDNANENEQT